MSEMKFDPSIKVDNYIRFNRIGAVGYFIFDNEIYLDVCKYPNRFQRFFYRLLFGIKFTKYKQKRKDFTEIE